MACSESLPSELATVLLIQPREEVQLDVFLAAMPVLCADPEAIVRGSLVRALTAVATALGEYDGEPRKRGCDAVLASILQLISDRHEPVRGCPDLAL